MLQLNSHYIFLFISISRDRRGFACSNLLGATNILRSVEVVQTSACTRGHTWPKGFPNICYNCILRLSIFPKKIFLLLYFYRVIIARPLHLNRLQINHFFNLCVFFTSFLKPRLEFESSLTSRRLALKHIHPYLWILYFPKWLTDEKGVLRQILTIKWILYQKM